MTIALTALPPEIWSMIFAHLAARDLCTAKLVCRHWRSIVKSIPLSAMCTFGDFGHVFSGCITVNTESIRVLVVENRKTPDMLDYFLVPGLAPLIRVLVKPLRGDWDAIPADFPLLDTIRHMVLDNCGLNVKLILTPSSLHPSRFSKHFGIPLSARWNDVESIIADEHNATTIDAIEYLLAIETLRFGRVDDETRFRNSLALMPNVNLAFISKISGDNLDCGLDMLPNLRNLEIGSLDDSRPLSRQNLKDIAKLRCLERLQVEDLGDKADLDALCRMFTSLPRLWFLNVDCSESVDWLKFIRTSKKLRHAMRNITHICARYVSDFDSVNAVAAIIETLSRLENINHITVHLSGIGPQETITAAKTKARQLRPARICIEIFE
jgi:hypothetical protein